jgi:hypothetical protein
MSPHRAFWAGQFDSLFFRPSSQAANIFATRLDVALAYSRAALSIAVFMSCEIRPVKTTAGAGVSTRFQDNPMTKPHHSVMVAEA